MFSDIRTRQHASKDIRPFMGLVTNAEDFRSIPPTYLSIAQNAQYDSQGNVRPKDGMEQWWPALPQRLQLTDCGEMEAGWTGVTGTISFNTAIKRYGFQSLLFTVASGAAYNQTATRTITGTSVAALVGNINSLSLGLRASIYLTAASGTPATNFTTIRATLVTSVGTYTYDFDIGNASLNTWHDVLLGTHAFTATETVTSIAFTVVAPNVAVARTARVDDVYLAAVSGATGSLWGQIKAPTALSAYGGEVAVGASTYPLATQIFDPYGQFVANELEASWSRQQVVAVAYEGSSSLLVAFNQYKWNDARSQYLATGQPAIRRYSSAGVGITLISSATLATYGAPVAMTRLPNGNIVVSTIQTSGPYTHRVVEFTSAGAYVDDVRTNFLPRLTFDSGNNIYVCAGNGNFYIYATGGLAGAPAYTGTFGHGVGAVAGDGTYLFVADSDTDTVKRYATGGAPGAASVTVGSSGTGPGQFVTTSAICTDATGAIYVADSSRNDVQKFDAAGTYLFRLAPNASYAEDSFCVGQHEFKKLSSPLRYHVAVFGETLYADANEARAPYKIKSGQTRNIPHYFTTFENREMITNGVDPNLIWTGTMYRTAGYPVPVVSSVTLTASTSGGAMVAGTYQYWMSFVYGEGSVMHGESSVVRIGSATVASGTTGSVALAVIPTGTVYSGVVRRRIYRSLVGADSYASAYLVTEIADNTTTTYTDTALDDTIIANKIGNTDNGIPPIAKYTAYYERGMVYMKGNQINYSRPGLNLDETPETVPALNLIYLPPSGDLTGSRQLGANLYIFMQQAIYAAAWSGSDLVVRPVKAAAQQGIGAMDENCITLKEDRKTR